MKIGIGNDHAAVELKNIISEHLKERGCEVVNFGTDTSESFDYPIAGYKVGKAVANGDVDLGILICGTGVGMPPRARSRAWTSGRLPTSTLRLSRCPSRWTLRSAWCSRPCASPFAATW